MWLRVILLYLIKRSEMSEGKDWNSDEDELIQTLKNSYKNIKWEAIAEKVNQVSNSTKTGTDCRFRYNSYLVLTQRRDHWSPEEEHQMYEIHDAIGNKWAIIASRLPGRSDNCVKNHFYSKLRRVVRHLNRVIAAFYRVQFREIKETFVYKILESAAEKFKKKPKCSEAVSNYARDIKNKMLLYSNDITNQDLISTEDRRRARDLLLMITEFGKMYRRKSKKERKSSAQDNELGSSLLKFKFDFPAYKSDDEEINEVKEEAKESEDNKDIEVEEKQPEMSVNQEENAIMMQLEDLTEKSLLNIGNMNLNDILDDLMEEEEDSPGEPPRRKGTKLSHSPSEDDNFNLDESRDFVKFLHEGFHCMFKNRKTSQNEDQFRIQ